MSHIAKYVSYIISTNRFWNMYKYTHARTHIHTKENITTIKEIKGDITQKVIK